MAANGLRTDKIWIDGGLIPYDEANIHVLSHSLHYGLAVFEGMRCYKSDNGRSAMLGSQFQDMLRCIRCGACMNHCPVYRAVGGHSYGWVYPGPMGSVLTPMVACPPFTAAGTAELGTSISVTSRLASSFHLPSR